MKLNPAPLRSKKPNFFILGAPKCGTSSLAAWLATNPQVFMSPVKEPHFFNTDDRRLFSTTEAYEGLFSGVADQHVAIGEASVWYLSSSEAVKNILRYQPDARFIVMFRNPVEMAPALHAEMVLSGLENVGDFYAAWNLQESRRHGKRLPAFCWARRRLLYGENCLLGTQYRRLLSLVPENRVLPILLDDILDNPRSEYLRALEFLGVDDDGRSEFPAYNRARRLRWPSLARQGVVIAELKRRIGVTNNFGFVRAIADVNIVEKSRDELSAECNDMLTKYFQKDVEMLGVILNRDLTDWLFSRTNRYNSHVPHV
jgi:hypothetical protein